MARILAALPACRSKEATSWMFAGILRASSSSLDFFSEQGFAADNRDGSPAARCDEHAC